jgi:hypothetical protein
VFNFQIEGGAYFGFDFNYNYAQLASQYNNAPAYGYMNLQHANRSSLLDFNRNKDGAMYAETPNAPMGVHTYDVFSATAQGLHSNFRTHRSDVGIVYDNATSLVNNNTYKGNELGIGGFGHYLHESGVSIYVGSGGLWNTLLNQTMGYYDPNTIVDALNLASVDKTYETNYFKAMGELTASDALFEASINNESVVKPVLTNINATQVAALNPLAGASSSSAISKGAITRSKRDRRNSNVSYLTAEEANRFGVEKTIRTYPQNAFSIDQTSKLETGFTAINRITGTSSDIIDPTVFSSIPINRSGIPHQLSEISITKDNGSRYVYGIPVYNKIKKKVAFNASDINNDLGGSTVSALSKDVNNEMVNYDWKFR